MLFYRVETKDGQGPYNPNKDSNIPKLADYMEKKYLQRTNNSVEEFWCRYYDAYLSSHSLPERDSTLSNIIVNMNKQFGYSFLSEYVFGFSSFEQVFEWFYMEDEMSFLKDYNFQISIYESDDMYAGESQSIAYKKTLKFVDSLSFA